MASSGQTSSLGHGSGDCGTRQTPRTAGTRPTSAARFAATRWSVVLAANNWRAGTDARRAMDELVQAYWFPLYAYLRRRGCTPPQAEDLVQGFFARLLEKDALALVDRERGKFRSFLLTSLKHFMTDEHRKATADKRGGARQIFSLDTPDAEGRYALALADTITPEKVFERTWAIAVLNQVVTRLEGEYSARGRDDTFSALRHCLDGQTDTQSYTELAERLGMTETALRVTVHRMRQRYRELLREEILQTVADPGLVDEELRYLAQCL
ncbi:MAG: sigma-70 family RNA polymerase sigma factor [Planctomycetes bacterium]|nr:sigma-70 family RNA polymerase sigma factor [Planctomycetota bacterium]